MKRRERFGRDEGGQVAILVAIMFLALVFVVAVVVNTSQLFITRRSAQTAADAGALAGAQSYALVADQAIATSAALEATKLNGYQDGVGGVTVLVGFPANPPNGSKKAVEVDITATVDSTLVPAWGLSTVHASGIAAAGAPASQAIIALGKSPDQTELSSSHGGSLTLYSLSAPAQCLTHFYDPATPDPCDAYGGLAWVDGAGCASAGGGAKDAAVTVNQVGPPNAGLNVAGCASGPWPTGNVTQGATPIDDPYADWVTKKPSTSGVPIRTAGTCSGSCDMLPGVYPITESWKNNALYNMCPGVFIFAGSGISIGGSGGALATIAADGTNCGGMAATPAGVLIFLTFTSYQKPPDPPLAPTGADTCASLSVTGNGSTSELDPQATGPFAGMLIYGDPACDGSTARLTLSVTYSGGGQLITKGLIYLPTGTANLHGNGTQAVSGLIAQTIDVQNGNVIAIVSARAAGVETRTRLVQ